MSGLVLGVKAGVAMCRQPATSRTAPAATYPIYFCTSTSLSKSLLHPLCKTHVIPQARMTAMCICSISYCELWRVQVSI